MNDETPQPPESPRPDDAVDGLQPYVPSEPPTAPPAAPPPAGPPPAGPPAAGGGGDGDWWYDDQGTLVDPADPAAPAAKRSPKVWIATGVGVAALAAASVVGINVASSHMSEATTQSAAGGDSSDGPGGQAFGPNGGQRPGAGGTIAGIDGTTITVTTRDGSTEKVTTSSSTTYAKLVAGTVADLKTGDNVTVMGTSTDDTSVAATRIVDSGTQADDGPGGGPGFAPPEGTGGQLPAPPDDASGQAPSGNGPPAMTTGGFGGMRRGTVAGVDGSTVTVTTTNGDTVTVTTSASTTVTLRQTGSFGDLVTGDEIQVRGTTADDGTVSAAAITEGDQTTLGGPGGFGPGGQNGQNGQSNRAGRTPPTTA